MKKNDILLILIPLSLFVLTWIGFSVYHNIVTSTISQPLSVQIIPIIPTFDTNTINNLKTRENIPPIYELSVPTPTPGINAPVAIPASPSAAQITNTVQATNEGSLLQ